jgi:hypothetical protein
MTAPSEKISVFSAPCIYFDALSGAMNSVVPGEALPRRAKGLMSARSISLSLMLPSSGERVTRMLSGLRSLCAKP